MENNRTVRQTILAKFKNVEIHKKLQRCDEKFGNLKKDIILHNNKITENSRRNERFW